MGSIEPQHLYIMYTLDDESIARIREETNHMTSEEVLVRAQASCSPDTVRSGGVLDLMYQHLVSERLATSLYLEIYSEKLKAEHPE